MRILSGIIRREGQRQDSACHLEDDVLGACPAGEGSSQLDSDHLEALVYYVNVLFQTLGHLSSQGMMCINVNVLFQTLGHLRSQGMLCFM